MLVDAIIATFNREDCIVDAVNSLLEYRSDLGKVYVVVNGSTDKTMDMLSVYDGDAQVEIIEQSTNLGAPGGKNIGMLKSDADVIIIIDDDAVFFTENPVSKIRDIFSNESTLGIIQFKVVNYDLKKVMDYEFPGDDVNTQENKEFLISSFTGAGHAVRKSMLEEVGYYPDSFFYAHEELDLSFRAIIGEWKIKYIPSVGVYHKKNPKGRMPENKMIEKMVVNRMLIAYSYLPIQYRLVSGILWLGKSALWSRSLVVPVKALLQYFNEKKSVTRRPVNQSSMKYLKTNFGRLWY
jgi:GT2 family glycosyltransferase